MPNRIIRECALTSHTLAKLSGDAERLFWRLTVVADDAGRFDAFPETVKARCFPVLVDSLKTSKVRAWLDELSTDHVTFYEVAGRAYGVFRNWAKYQRAYGFRSKFPEPPADCGNLPQPTALIRDPRSENRDPRIEIRSTSGGLPRPTGFPEPWEVEPWMIEYAEGFKLNPHATFAHFRDHHVAKGSVFKSWPAAFRNWCRTQVAFNAKRGGR